MDQETLKKLQQTELKILTDFADYCATHGLRYYLIGGALLGAARYQDFIPWDDDVDVAMPREDYERLKQLWSQQGVDGYFLQHSGTDPHFARCIMKLRKNNTLLKEKNCNHLPMHQGIYIDIFPIDYTNAENVASLHDHAEKIRRLMTLRVIKAGYKGNHFFVKRLIRYAIFWLRADQIEQMITRLCTRDNHLPHTHAVLYLHNYHIDRQYHKLDVFGTGTKCAFSGKEFVAPADMNAFLAKVFGADYMQEPPLEKQVCPHNYLSVNFESST